MYFAKQRSFMKETMMPSIVSHVLLSLILCILLQEPTQAIKQPYIVYLGSHSFGPNPSAVDAESATNFHYNLLGSYVGSTEKAKEAIFYSYNRYINGFAAVLDEDEAVKIAKHPDVVSVFVSKRLKLHTTHSWDFLGLKRNGVFSHDSLPQEALGEDVIIGNLDTGVWPESKSFSDEGLGPVPKKWRGICQINDKIQDTFKCNRKLIGARYFYEGYKASGQPLNASLISARDYDGHGSHTLSTAGGNFVPGANVFGFGNGTASGGSPKARVASYKVCWPGCADADILAAFEAAIGDGVDVLSVSLGSNYPTEYFGSGASVGSFHAVANGVIVVSSAGNSGPSLSSVSNTEPWVLTVAASTIDRDFASYIRLGDKQILKGASLSEYDLPYRLYPLISGEDAHADDASESDALLCKKGTLDPMKVKGKIVVCVRGENTRTDKGVQAAQAGAVGMILANDEKSGNGIQADPHLLPASALNYLNSSYIFNYINSTKSPVAYISRLATELDVKPAPIVASFSSRGPNNIEPAILKPDITAPGVNIIAAYSEAASPTNEPSDKRKTPFTSLSGTSMSCPHVSGLAGLIKALHPDWSPAAIKSAIITSATTTDNSGGPILDSYSNEATPFDYGAGHIQPNLALDPGLVYDLNITDYLNFLCNRDYSSSQLKLFYGKPYTCPKSFNLADFNYPTITIPKFDPGHNSLNVTRTVTNVGSPSTYEVRINAPPQVVVSVEPTKLSFKETGEKQKFTATFTLKPLTEPKTGSVYGSLEWTDGNHHVRSPIVVNIQN